jgi:hypothetical protein
MDKSEFLGWRVRVTTKSKSVIEGVVTEVNDIDCRLVLNDAQVVINNKTRMVELVSVQGEDIVSLDVLSAASVVSSVDNIGGIHNNKQPSSVGIRDPAILRTSSEASLLHPRSSVQQPVAVAPPVSAVSYQTQQHPQVKNPWIADNVADLKRADFDIQANLQMFDKKKAFEDMKGRLKPEDLLVTHNQRPKTTGQQSSKEKPVVVSDFKPEKVVATRKQPQQPKEELPVQPLPVKLIQKSVKSTLVDDEPEYSEDQVAVEEGRNEFSKLKLSSSSGSVANLSSSSPVPAVSKLAVFGKSSITVPVVNEETMSLIEQKASKLTGPTTDQQLECAAREIMRVLLQDELASCPSNMAILVGNHREGAIALAVGRSFVNRGVSVTAWFVDNASSDHVAFQRKLFVSAGGECVDLGSREAVECEESVDVVIDGSTGRPGKTNFDVRRFDSLSMAVLVGIERSAFSKCDILFALGFPKLFHVATAHHSRLYLVDINLPSASFKNALPSGTDFSTMAVFGDRLSVRIR